MCYPIRQKTLYLVKKEGRRKGELSYFPSGLRIEKEVYRTGGRLENYVDEDQLPEAVARASDLITKLHVFYNNHAEKTPFELLLQAEREKIGIE